jgi:homoserine kinase
MTAFAPGQVRVRVPATSANLGPGFDSLGLALALYDELAARVTSSGLTITVEGEGGESVLRDESHLVVRSMRAAFAALDAAPAGVELTCRNAIPHARGLGSSAAAIVAGVLLARGLVPDGADGLPVDDVLALCAQLEGHADNVAPCLLGGFTIAWHQDGRFRAVRRDVHQDVEPVALVPPTPSSTAVARGLLPGEVPHGDAAFTASRAALLVAAITAEPEQLLAATEDRLHQPYRAAAMPESIALVDRLRNAGLPAVISGAGPTVLVLARDQGEVERAGAEAPPGWRALPLPVDPHGAQVLRRG